MSEPRKQYPLILVAPYPSGPPVETKVVPEQSATSTPNTDANRQEPTFPYPFLSFADKHVNGKIIKFNPRPNDLTSIISYKNGASFYLRPGEDGTTIYSPIYNDGINGEGPSYITKPTGEIFYSDGGNYTFYRKLPTSLADTIFGKKSFPKRDPSISYEEGESEANTITVANVNTSVQKQLQTGIQNEQKQLQLKVITPVQVTKGKKTSKGKSASKGKTQNNFETNEDRVIAWLLKGNNRQHIGTPDSVTSKFRDSELVKLIARAISGTHKKIALIVKHIFADEIVRPGWGKGLLIYYWDKKTRLWVEGEPGLILRKLIGDEINPIYEECISRIKYELNREVERSKLPYEVAITSDATCMELDILNKQFNTILTKLETDPYLTSLTNSCLSLIVDTTFKEKLDNNPAILAVGSGMIIDLKTSECRPRVKSDYCTKALKRIYNPHASRFKTINFLNDIMLEDQGVINRLQMILGYCLTGSQSLKKFFIFYGSGDNGKSVLVGILKRIFGDYFRTVEETTIAHCNKNNINPSGHKAHILDLKGGRLGVTNDMSGDLVINSSLIKAITGNDEQRARGAYASDLTSFNPEIKFILLCNEIPEFSDKGKAQKNRTDLVPFKAKFVPNPNPNNKDEKLVDPDFTDNFINDEEAMDGFFSWLIEGAYIFYKGLAFHPPIPDVMSQAKREYISSIDYFERFVNEKLQLPKPEDIPGDNGIGVRFIPDGSRNTTNWRYPATQLHSTFQGWLSDLGVNYKDKAYGITNFGKAMKGLVSDRRMGNGIIYVCKDIEYDAINDAYNPDLPPLE